MRRCGIPARDLRILDPLLAYPSTILGREKAIVVNLEAIKAIITADEVRHPTHKDEKQARQSGTAKSVEGKEGAAGKCDPEGLSWQLWSDPKRKGSAWRVTRFVINQLKLKGRHGHIQWQLREPLFKPLCLVFGASYLMVSGVWAGAGSVAEPHGCCGVNLHGGAPAAVAAPPGGSRPWRPALAGCPSCSRSGGGALGGGRGPYGPRAIAQRDGSGQPVQRGERGGAGQ
jgi:hypothetical protein